MNDSSRKVLTHSYGQLLLTLPHCTTASTQLSYQIVSRLADSLSARTTLPALPPWFLRSLAAHFPKHSLGLSPHILEPRNTSNRISVALVMSDSHPPEGLPPAARTTDNHTYPFALLDASLSVSLASSLFLVVSLTVRVLPFHASFPLRCSADTVGGVRHAAPTRPVHVEPSNHEAKQAGAGGQAGQRVNRRHISRKADNDGPQQPVSQRRSLHRLQDGLVD